jgi:hypothetical protein
MARRSTPQRTIDERCFPIRVRFVIPATGMGYPEVTRMEAWLQANLPSGDFAKHPDSGTSFREAFAVHFRRLSDAHRFVEAFPDAELADGTALAGYTSPACHGAVALIDFRACAICIV